MLWLWVSAGGLFAGETSLLWQCQWGKYYKLFKFRVTRKTDKGYHFNLELYQHPSQLYAYGSIFSTKTSMQISTKPYLHTEPFLNKHRYGNTHKSHDRVRSFSCKWSGWFRRRCGCNSKHTGEFNHNSWWETILHHHGVDEDCWRRWRWETPANYCCCGGRKALHLQGTGWGQEMV